MLNHLKYPIGQPDLPTTITHKNIEQWILVIENFPAKLNELVNKLSDIQLDTR